METTLTIVLPVFGLILLGYLVGHTRLLSADGIKGLTGFVFYLAMPALLFRSMATLEQPEGIALGIIAAYFGPALLVYALAMLLGRVAFGHDLEQQAMFGMASTFSNSVLIGIPLTLAAFGERALLPTMLIISVHSMILMMLPTLLIELHRGRGGRWTAVLGNTLLSLVRNPVILGVVGGLLYGQAGLGLPEVIDRFAELLGRAGPPTALFAVGASLTGYKVGGDLREVAVAVFFKIVGFAALVWAAATYLLDLDPLSTAVAVTLAATPSGVNVFVLANAYGIYIARAAAAVLLTTAISWLTVAVLLSQNLAAPG